MHYSLCLCVINVVFTNDCCADIATIYGPLNSDINFEILFRIAILIVACAIEHIAHSTHHIVERIRKSGIRIAQ